MDWATSDYTQIYGDTIFVPPSTADEGIYVLDETNRGQDPNTDLPPGVPIRPYGEWDRPGLAPEPWRWPTARSEQSACRGGGRAAAAREAPSRAGASRGGREGFIGEDPRGGGAPGLEPILNVAWDERPGESAYSCRECSGAYQGCLHCGDPRDGVTEWSTWRRPYGAWPRCTEYQELVPPWSKRPYNGGPAPSQTYAIGGPWRAIPPKPFRLPSAASLDARCDYGGWEPPAPGKLPSPPLEVANPPEPFVSQPPCGCPS